MRLQYSPSHRDKNNSHSSQACDNKISLLYFEKSTLNIHFQGTKKENPRPNPGVKDTAHSLVCSSPPKANCL